MPGLKTWSTCFVLVIGAILAACLLALDSRSNGDRISPRNLGSLPYSTDKRLVHHGWCMPTARWAAENLAKLEATPFDGMVFPPGDEIAMVFDHRPWATKIDRRSLKIIGRGRFTDNFLLVFSNEEFGVDYFDHAQWKIICANMQSLARAARDNGFAGFFFDVEPYSGAPWSVKKMAKGHARSEVESKVRQRGKEVMKAVQQVYPEVVVLMTFCLSYVPEDWELLPFWVNGMLDALGPEARLVEGDEESYYWGTTSRWFSRYGDLKLGKESLAGAIAPENLAKYHTQVEIGKAAYSRQSFFAKEAYDLDHQLPAEWSRKKWEHNVYMGMATADRYVWCYTEKVNALGVPAGRQPLGWGVAPRPWPNVLDGIRSAEQKYSDGKPLGWDMHSANLWKPGSPDSSISVTLETPSGGARFGPEAKVEVRARARGKAVKEIVFYCNVVEVGRSPGKAGRISMEGLPVGRYTFLARAFGAGGRHGTSAPVTATVTPSQSDGELALPTNRRNVE